MSCDTLAEAESDRPSEGTLWLKLTDEARVLWV